MQIPELIGSDELDIPPGSARFKKGGGHGGHNGLRSLIDELGDRSFLRVRLAALFDGEAAAAIRILYGGSLKPSNAHELLALDDVDGGLIGGASLDVRSFFAIIRAAADCAAGE